MLQILMALMSDARFAACQQQLCGNLPDDILAVTHCCIADAGAALARQARDTALADALMADGLEAFVQSWYQQPMWSSLVKHPRLVNSSFSARPPPQPLCSISGMKSKFVVLSIA